jgi:hypothetical protein
VRGGSEDIDLTVLNRVIVRHCVVSVRVIR